MKKIKRTKSLIASKDNNYAVQVKGDNKRLTRAEMKAEHDGLLAILAAMIEDSGGIIQVSKDTINKVTKAGRKLVLVNGKLTIGIQFDDYIEKQEEKINDTDGKGNFLESTAARDARKYLEKLRGDSDTGDSV
jgi:hypothetical protein